MVSPAGSAHGLCAGSGVRWAQTQPCPCSREGYPTFISSCANERRQPPSEGTFPWLTTISSPGVAVAPRARFVPGNPLWCPRRMREKNRGTAGSCGTPRSRAGRKIWKNSGLSPWMHRWICSASAGKSHHTQRLNQARLCLSLLLPRYPRAGQKGSLLKRNIKTSFCLVGKIPIKPKPAPCAWKSRDGREQLMEPHPYGAGKQQEVTQQGRTQQENRVWPRQSHPSLHKCGRTLVFPLWDDFFECYKLCCKEK